MAVLRFGLRERRASWSSVKFAQQLGGSRSRWVQGCFGLKPKLHLWLELCASGGKPVLVSGRTGDEDFGGDVRALGTQERRAFETPLPLPGVLLDRFLIKVPVPRR